MPSIDFMVKMAHLVLDINIHRVFQVSVREIIAELLTNFLMYADYLRKEIFITCSVTPIFVDF